MDTKQKNRPEQPRKRAAEPRTGKAPAGSKATQKSRRQMPCNNLHRFLSL